MIVQEIDLNPIPLEPITGHSSKGNQPKWQVRNRWYKADHMGYEALVEILVSRLLAKTNISDFVAYTPARIQYQGKSLRGCVSQNFRGQHEMLIPVERLHRAYHGKGLAEAIGSLPTAAERIRYTVDFIERTTGLSHVGPYLTMILELDQLFLNEDRHTNNLAVIRNEKTLSFRLCPIFDNGLSLLSDLNDYPLDGDIYACIERVRAKPFSLDFDNQVEGANLLYGSFLKCLFTRDDVRKQLDELAGFYPDTILQRVERILYEQMRRYGIYF